MATRNPSRATSLERWLKANPITVSLLQKGLAWLAASSALKHVIAYFAK
jgi:hypothetical protein